MIEKYISLVLLDVDGVLTDGSLWIGPEGEIAKRFNVKDGLGIKLLQENNIDVGIITGRFSKALETRLEELHINTKLVFQGVSKKLHIYEKILKELQINKENVAYMGDDLPDIPVLEKVGLPAAPSNAAPEVKRIATFLAPCAGGDGAVRALAEYILKSQDRWPY